MKQDASKAFVVINVKIGSEGEAFKKLKNMVGIKEVHVVYGAFDIVAHIEANSLEELKEQVANIRNMDSVRSTLTMIVANR